jgi:NADPH:quinone reductase-like Zn-dependent oxidoreductase/ubiquinone/menaquinone biosynthesis C-methylase UbiE
LDHRDWYEFELCSVTQDDSWIRHCKGYVLAETATTMRKSITKAENQRPGLESFFPPGARVNDVEPDSTFASMRKMGIYHGPAFRNLIGSKVAGERSVTDLNMSPEALKKDDEYVLHPTTLDSIFQTCYFCLSPESKEGAMLVPCSIGSLSIPGRLGRHAGHKLQSFVQLLGLSSRKASFRGSVFPNVNDGEFGVPLQMHNMRLQRVQPAEDEGLQNVSRVHSQARWELDILHNIPATVRDSMQIWLNENELAYEKRLREAAYHLMVDAIARLEKDNSEAWQDYHKRYHSWIKTVVHAVENGQLAHAAALGCKAWPERSQSAKKSILNNLAEENAGGELLCRIGRQLAQIIRGDVHPLELMMESGLLHKYYTDLPQFANCYKQLRRVIELYAAKEPGAEVLEIGAGTGGATMHVLEAFAARAAVGTSGSVVGHYDYTDISADFFVTARQKFAIWEDRMSFAKLDIEFDPIPQGFTSGSYDLIIASQVLHATKSLDNTLSNTRKLLKPGGKLVMLEGTQHSIDLELIFGTLPGWWLGQEPERQMSAIADIHTWNKLLKANGFSGVDVVIGNCEQPETQVSSVIVATAVAAKPLYPSSISVVHGRNTPKEFLDDLAKSIQVTTGTIPDVESFEKVSLKHDTLYLITVEMDYPLVGTMDSATFEKVRSLLVNSMGIFWIGCGGAVEAQKPLWAETTGLLRTFRREDQNKRCIQLDFEVTSEPWAREKISHIMHVFEESFDYNMDISNRNMDWEFAVKDSMLHVPRLYPDVALDTACNGSTPAAEPRAWHEPGKDLVVSEDSKFAEVPEMVDPVPRGMVEVETKAFGLNFQDVMLATGLVQDVLIRTHEAAGTVKRLGPGTKQSGLRVGDRVCGAFRGGFASTSRAWWTNIIKVPTDVKMSWEEAAAFPTAYLTAHVGFCHIARLEPRERVLIHSAAGGVGQAAIMLAQHVGAEVFVTCGTEDKRRLLIERYNIPEDHIFNSRDSSFASGVMARTDGQGVDVVLNSLAGPLLKATWECMARFGRFVEIGKVDFHGAKHLDMTPFGRNVSLAGVDLVQYSELKGMVIHDALVDLMNLYRCGQIKSLHPITSFSISKLREAMEQMQTGMHMGKLVLAIKPDDIVNVVPRAPSLDLANMNITHLIVGGLRGVGYAIALWMMEKGANYMLCVSRNALSHPNLPVLQKKATEHGCTLVVRNCDIADEKSFLELLDSVKKLNIPPIRGVVQAAMVLDVGSPILIQNP